MAKDFSDDDLIRVINLADYLVLPPVVHSCAYVLAHRLQNKTLTEVREVLHEEDDFTEKERALISDIPELTTS